MTIAQPRTRKAILLALCGALLWACGGVTESNPEGDNGGGAAGSDTAGTSAGGSVAVAGSGGASAGGGGASHGGKGGASHGGSAGASHGGSGGASHGGSGGAGMGGSGGAGATMAEVQAIFNAHCINCHDKSKMGLPTFGQLSLLPGEAHDALVNKHATEACGGIYVVPGDPPHSYLMNKVTQAMPCEGQQMPRPFEIIKPPPLTTKELATIRSWITTGAPP